MKNAVLIRGRKLSDGLWEDITPFIKRGMKEEQEVFYFLGIFKTTVPKYVYTETEGDFRIRVRTEAEKHLNSIYQDVEIIWRVGAYQDYCEIRYWRNGKWL